tara:strand:- start:1011 stop:1238 length:228 start_codon:yes stop_codon:yes gene_type:complete
MKIMEDEKKYTHPEQAMLALKMAIEEEMPKLKEGQKLKAEIKETEEGIKIHVYPVAKDEQDGSTYWSKDEKSDND